MKYIIDTDPGIDDAIAIMLGLKNNLNVIGFTLATGNIAPEKSEKNLKIIQDFMETNIKMYKGSHSNKVNLKTAEYAHGKDGLGYAVFPNNNKRKIEKSYAEDFIIKAAKKYKDDLTIICLGPLTNLANAIKKEPKLYNYLKHVVIMGTTFNPENSEPYMEFNVSVDPEAANIVYSTPFQDVKIVTHEIGIKSYVEKDYIQNLTNSEDLVSRFVGVIAIKYMEFCEDHYGIIGLGTPDPTTIAAILDPTIIEFKPCKVNIVAKGKKKGVCDITLENSSNFQVSVDLNVEKFRNIFKKTFK